MTKKTLVIILGMLVCLSSGAMAQKVVWVSDNQTGAFGAPTVNDQGFLDVLTADGYTVTRELQTVRGVLTTDMKTRLEAADVIIISRALSSGSYNDPAGWNGISKPIISLMPHVIRNDGSRWKWLNTGTSSDTLAENNLTAVVPAHPIFAGVTFTGGQVDVVTTATSFTTVTTAGNGTVLARRASDNNVWIVLWNKGIEFYDGSGQFAGGPRMVFYLGEKTSGTRDGVYNLTDEGKKLFINAARFFAPDPTFNPAPKAVAGPKYSHIYPGGSVQLDGTITDLPPMEGDPGVLSWYWKQESGPAAVTFAPNTAAEDPIATFSAEGMYTLLLQATDGTKDANDVVTVFVADRADEKLVGYWNMEQNVIDQSDNSNDGVLKGDAAYDSDSAIGDFSINLITESATDPNTLGYIYLGNAPELDFGYPAEFTVAAWVKTASIEQSNIFTKGGDEDGGIRYFLSVGETDGPRGRGEFIVDDNVTKVVATGTTLVNDGKWHFVVGVKDLASSRVYVDGVLNATATLPANYNLSGTSQTAAYIGIGILSPTDADRADPNTPFDVFKAGLPFKDINGRVDDIRIFNYPLALTDAEGFDSVRTLTAMGSVPATVDAGADDSFLMKPGLSYPLAGVITDYGKPDIQTILWTTVSGPDDAEAIFASPSSPTSTVTFPKGGVYTLKLTVIDVTGTSEDTVVITTTTPSCADVVTAGLLMKTDLTGDCVVNLQDLAKMLENWTQCVDPEDINCTWPF